MEAYPLHWPEGRARTSGHMRQHSRFDVTPDRARRELRAEAERHGRNVIISTNIALRRDGEPYANRRSPEDTGVAVYLTRKGRPVCFACDQYKQVWENMRAIYRTLEAMRGIERWGSAEMLDRAFMGFEALPSPDTITSAPNKAWWEILGVTSGATEQEVRDAYKARCRENGCATVELNNAKETALRVVVL